MMSRWVTKNWRELGFALAALGMLISYPWVRSIMLVQETVYSARIGNSVNIVIIFGLVGHLLDKRTKGMSKKKKNLIWAATMASMIIILHLVGIRSWIFK